MPLNEPEAIIQQAQTQYQQEKAAYDIKYQAYLQAKATYESSPTGPVLESAKTAYLNAVNDYNTQAGYYTQAKTKLESALKAYPEVQDSGLASQQLQKVQEAQSRYEYYKSLFEGTSQRYTQAVQEYKFNPTEIGFKKAEALYVPTVEAYNVVEQKFSEYAAQVKSYNEWAGKTTGEASYVSTIYGIVETDWAYLQKQELVVNAAKPYYEQLYAQRLTEYALYEAAYSKVQGEINLLNQTYGTYQSAIRQYPSYAAQYGYINPDYPTLGSPDVHPPDYVARQLESLSTLPSADFSGLSVKDIQIEGALSSIAPPNAPAPWYGVRDVKIENALADVAAPTPTLSLKDVQVENVLKQTSEELSPTKLVTPPELRLIDKDVASSMEFASIRLAKAPEQGFVSDWAANLGKMGGAEGSLGRFSSEVAAGFLEQSGAQLGLSHNELISAMVGTQKTYEVPLPYAEAWASGMTLNKDIVAAIQAKAKGSNEPTQGISLGELQATPESQYYFGSREGGARALGAVGAEVFSLWLQGKVFEKGISVAKDIYGVVKPNVYDVAYARGKLAHYEGGWKSPSWDELTRTNFEELNYQRTRDVWRPLTSAELRPLSSEADIVESFRVFEKNPSGGLSSKAFSVSEVPIKEDFSPRWIEKTVSSNKGLLEDRYIYDTNVKPFTQKWVPSIPTKSESLIYERTGLRLAQIQEAEATAKQAAKIMPKWESGLDLMQQSQQQATKVTPKVVASVQGDVLDLIKSGQGPWPVIKPLYPNLRPYVGEEYVYQTYGGVGEKPSITPVSKPIVTSPISVSVGDLLRGHQILEAVPALDPLVSATPKTSLGGLSAVSPNVSLSVTPTVESVLKLPVADVVAPKFDLSLPTIPVTLPTLPSTGSIVKVSGAPMDVSSFQGLRVEPVSLEGLKQPLFEGLALPQLQKLEQPQLQLYRLSSPQKPQTPSYLNFKFEFPSGKKLGSAKARGYRYWEVTNPIIKPQDWLKLGGRGRRR